MLDAPRDSEPRLTAPTAFRYWQARETGVHQRLRDRVLKLTGVDLFPPDDVARAFIDGLNRGDPVAERFVSDTYHGDLGARRARALVEKAQQVGIDNVPEAPESMRALFAEHETVPDWVDRRLVEQGAAVWRRWGYALGAVGNAATMDTYTEGYLATPLSLSGGYAGERALHRYLETTKWWLEVSRPGAVLQPGSLARVISLHVRIMHVSIRARVAEHPEWDASRWGLPISQSAMLLTLLGGSVGPALALLPMGYLTSPAEIRACLHFNRYLGHLVGVRCDFYPETVLDGWRLLFMADAARSYDSGPLGAELVESFVPSFRRRAEQRGVHRLRADYHFWLQAGYGGLCMLPWNRRRYDMPSAIAGAAYLLARAPLITAVEVARRIVPAVDREWQRRSHAGWQRWAEWQAAGKAARFDAGRRLRR